MSKAPSKEKTIRKWILGILSTVISAVLIYFLIGPNGILKDKSDFEANKEGVNYTLMYKLKDNETEARAIIFIDGNKTAVLDVDKYNPTARISKYVDKSGYHTYSLQVSSSFMAIIDPEFPEMEVEVSNSYTGKGSILIEDGKTFIVTQEIYLPGGHVEVELEDMDLINK